MIRFIKFIHSSLVLAQESVERVLEQLLPNCPRKEHKEEIQEVVASLANRVSMNAEVVAVLFNWMFFFLCFFF